MAGIVDDEIRLAKVLELLFGWTDEHIVLSEVGNGKPTAKMGKSL